MPSVVRTNANISFPAVFGFFEPLTSTRKVSEELSEVKNGTKRIAWFKD